MRDDGLWTIAELSAQVAQALAESGPGSPNGGAPNGGVLSGRVREVPDTRTIRWYTTIGLLDRPAAMRGRTALYGSRHLLQLVAIKRLQAAGRSLAEVQQELLGATDTTLERISQVVSERPRFWAAQPVAAVTPVPLVCGARLANGVTLLLDPAVRLPDEEDLAAIEQAAGPLLDVLNRRGLIHANVRRES